MKQQELTIALKKKLEEFEATIQTLKTKKNETLRQIEIYQRNLAQINAQLHEQELMQSPLLELLNSAGLGVENRSSAQNLNDINFLTERILEYIKRKGRVRKSEISDRFGGGDRSIEMQTYRIVDRLQWYGKIKPIPELLPNGKQRERDLLYEVIS